METSINFIVNYADTDAYKVAWHGSYLRWMEAGRVDFLYKNGIDIKKLDEEENIIMPVVEINIKYKQSAKLMDKVIVKTKIIEKTKYYVIFEQTVEGQNGEIFVKATVKGVGIKDNKLMRDITDIFK